MSRLLPILLVVCAAPAAFADGPPVAPVRPVTDDYHGTKVADPYRYMEDFKSADVQKWVKGQAEYATKTLNAIPGRDALLKRITELDAGAPYRAYGFARQPNGDLFYFKQLATENVAKFYHRDGKTQRERLLIDPEAFPKKNPKEHFSLSVCRVSPDATKVLYGFAASGSEQTTLKVFDLATGKDLPEAIDRMEAEYAPPYWLPDSSGFVYSRRRKLPEKADPTEGYKFTQAFLHALGSPVEKDVMIFAAGAAGSPKLAEMDFPAVILPLGSKWAVGQVKHGDETDISLYVTPREALGGKEIRWIKVCDRADQVTEFAVRGDDIFLLTAKDAPRFKVVRTTLAEPDLKTAVTVVPAGSSVVNGFAVAKDALYVGVSDGVPNTVLRVPHDTGKPEPVEPPKDEPSAFVSAVRPDLPGAWLYTSSWSREGRLLAYDPSTAKLTDTKLLPVGKFDTPDWLTSTEVMVPSHDGVKVPLSIVHRKDIKLDGSNPTLMSGYGAYGFGMPMYFDPVNLAWLERGGVLATAHVRGGGAFGKEWHHAGRRATKPNTWKDFIACGEYLVKQKYTSPAKLCGEGGSAGGILIGRAITERPDLFAAAHISVGCTDMLRFETTMNGPPNIPEFGSTRNKDEFPHLLAMSSYHQVKDGAKYPAVLLTHGINDPRVEPWESAKMTARLQAATASGKPVLFRVDYQAGHGIGSTKAQRHEEQADVWAFLLWQTGEKGFRAGAGEDGPAAPAKTLAQRLADLGLRKGKANPEVRDAFIQGYALGGGGKGWAEVRDLLADRGADFLSRYSVLRNLDPLREAAPDVVTAGEYLAAMNDALEQPDLADLAVDRLRAAGVWGLTDKVLALELRQTHQLPIFRRSVARYALSAPGEASKKYIDALRKTDPDLVAAQEELLKPAPKK